MDFSLLKRTTALSAAVVGMGLLSVAPVIADNHGMQTDMQTESEAMSEPATGEMTDEMSSEMSSNTIVDIASGSENFSTLVEAVTAANLAGTLSEAGPYTVFAPTNEAFASLPEGALEFLLEPENEDLLSQVLTYHVVAGETLSSDLSTGGIDALSGGLAVGVFDSGVVINNASVTQADVQASNGVIHQVNRVLIPEALQQTLAARLGVSDLYQ